MSHNDTAMRCACGIDAHAHVVPENFPDYPGAARPADLEPMGLSLQVVSPMPELLSYWMAPADAQQLLRYLNERIAAMVFSDTLVFDDAALRYLVQAFGASQLLVGTDHPFNFHDRTPVQRIEAAGFDADTVQKLVHRNAERFLGLNKEQTP